jgi:hypothetical protein
MSAPGIAQKRWLAALVGVAVAAVALVALDPTALCLLPALALAMPLLLRRYPGERLIVVLSRAGRQRWPRPRASRPYRRRAVEVAVARGGLLLALSLAVRPPPVAAAI